MSKIRKEIAGFHGEMILLENYSALNYIGLDLLLFSPFPALEAGCCSGLSFNRLLKILKKYDKRTGALIRVPFIQKALQQPFFTIDLLYKLVKEYKKMLNHLFPREGHPSFS
ncbi:hypothetical protein MLD38_005762 [Melastoma candidum]|uniref:Uncharacterized protein n=1 Tax=Melastoma candidum TaxID=119954 RepID=A0ACB9RKF9_9MYRT|nr:hypothetical protein MLD38_005762 [Melastoma candidum]